MFGRVITTYAIMHNYVLILHLHLSTFTYVHMYVGVTRSPAPMKGHLIFFKGEGPW